MWTTGLNSPFELIMNSKYHTVKDIAHNIKCPTLVLEADKDDSFPGQQKKYMMRSHVQEIHFVHIGRRC